MKSAGENIVVTSVGYFNNSPVDLRLIAVSCELTGKSDEIFRQVNQILRKSSGHPRISKGSLMNVIHSNLLQFNELHHHIKVDINGDFDKWSLRILKLSSITITFVE